MQKFQALVQDSWKRVNHDELAQLLKKGVIFVKGLKSKKGNPFAAWLVLKESRQVVFSFKDPLESK